MFRSPVHFISAHIEQRLLRLEAQLSPRLVRGGVALSHIPLPPADYLILYGGVGPHHLLEGPDHLEDGVASTCAQVIDLQSSLTAQNLLQCGHMTLSCKEGEYLCFPLIF